MFKEELSYVVHFCPCRIFFDAVSQTNDKHFDKRFDIITHVEQILTEW